MTPEELSREIGLRSRPGAPKRYMSDELAEVVRFAFDRACARRGGSIEEVLAARTAVYAVVLLPWATDVNGLADAVRLVTSRRARRVLHWPTNESVFTRRLVYWRLGSDAPAVELAWRFPELSRV
ncbi:MAG: hypothetical protein ACOYN0_10715 [Phycisphaerales bacterium]